MVQETADKKEIHWTVPEDLKIPPDTLRARIDFYHQACTLSFFDGEVFTTRVVSAMDIAHTLSEDMAFGTGLLPPDTLWWRNTRNGPYIAIYVAPKSWRVALEFDIRTPPRRYNLPMPGLIFLCSPGKAPWVYAVTSRPTKETDDIYHAPLCNVHENGLTCAGNHNYPPRLADMPKSFFTSFFTASAHLKKRSKAYPANVVHLWDFLDGKHTFPIKDLVRIGNIKDLLVMEM
jgi:hypothetical protein